MREIKCPKCSTENQDNWPVCVNGKLLDGGCQMCWEAECDEAWWDAVANL